MNKTTLDSYIRTLAAISPQPLGRGFTYEQAAQFLGIHERNLRKRVARFKVEYPEEYLRWQDKLEGLDAMAEKLRHPDSIDIESMAHDGDDTLANIKWRL